MCGRSKCLGNELFFRSAFPVQDRRKDYLRGDAERKCPFSVFRKVVCRSLFEPIAVRCLTTRPEIEIGV